MKKLIIFTISLLLTISTALFAEENSASTKETVKDIKKENIENVEKTKEESEKNIEEITGEDKKTEAEKEKIKEAIKPDKSNKSSKSEETRTLFSFNRNKRPWMSGYFAPAVRFSQVNETKFSTFVGYKGAFIIENFCIGTGFFMNADYKKRFIKNKDRKVYMGYGGLLLEYNFFRKRLVNFSIGSIVGAGTAGYVKTGDFNSDGHEEHRYVGTRFFVLEPEIVMYINVTKFFRLGIGGSYRYIYGLKQYDLNDKTYSGFSGSLILQFGWF